MVPFGRRSATDTLARGDRDVLRHLVQGLWRAANAARESLEYQGKRGLTLSPHHDPSRMGMNMLRFMCAALS